MKHSIYVLEDDEGIRELIQFLLEEEGYQVKSFPTVKAFEEGIQQGRPDLVILDIWLPDGDGREVCRELREESSTSDLLILLMTAHQDIQKIECSDDFISKPFDIADLVERIERLLQGAGKK